MQGLGDGGSDPPDDEPVDLSDLRWDDAIVLVVFWGLAVVVFLQFFTRYILNDSLAWTEEIARFLLIAVTFIGAIMATRKGSHIAVEFLFRWMNRPVRRVVQAIIDLVSVAFFAALTLFSIQLAGRTGQMMVSIDVPKSLVYWGCRGLFRGDDLPCRPHRLAASALRHEPAHRSRDPRRRRAAGRIGA